MTGIPTGQTVVSGTRNRIGSIDALRGIALLGILLVHSISYFSYTNGGINDFSFVTSFGHKVESLVYLLLEGRSNKVFSTLFGVSFYLILRNPSYTSKKFVWRCVLLAIIGFLNKFFYSNDTLVWYGVLGCILTLFRNLNPKQLFLIFVFLFVVSWFPVVLYEYPNQPIRYVFGQSLLDVIRYPLDNGYIAWFSVFPTSDLAFFVLGYCVGKKGIIEHINEYLTKKNIIVFAGLYVVFFLVYLIAKSNFDMLPFVKNSLKAFRNLFGSIFYVLIFMKIYYRWPSVFKPLESYGKLGLTNYSFQGILGVTISLLIIIPFRLSLEYALLIYVGLYLIQMWFSAGWLRYFKNGPMEWLWRSLTNRKFSSPFLEIKKK